MPRTNRLGRGVDIDHVLRHQFNRTSFRPPQREIITASLEGHDVVVQAATGFGKSLCFQLPAVVNHGVTIVVSPLLSLMVDALRASRVNARTLNGYTTLAERNAIYHDLATGHPRIRLLYVTPELCSSHRFRRLLHLVHRQCELYRIVIDEAHCISEWGHDFRRDFARLGWFRATFPDVPIMCLTATANDAVLQDIVGIVYECKGSDTDLCVVRATSIKREHFATAPTIPSDGDRLKMFRLSPFRPNLHLAVRFVPSNEEGEQRQLSDFVEWYKALQTRKEETPAPERRKPRLLVRASMRVPSQTNQVPNQTPNQTQNQSQANPPVSGIIYTLTRAECEQLARALAKEGVGARPFHAQLSQDDKQQTMDRWLRNEADAAVIVATTAFGMGVDKLDTRFVVHWRMPKSFEGYCQEIGRAGRDGRAADCVLYYSRGDGGRLLQFMAKRVNTRGEEQAHCRAKRASLKRLMQYCEDTDGCRHAAISAYFGFGAAPPCTRSCDWHVDADALKEQKRACWDDQADVSSSWIASQEAGQAPGQDQEFEF